MSRGKKNLYKANKDGFELKANYAINEPDEVRNLFIGSEDESCVDDGDEDEAMKALLINPLCRDYNKFKPAYDELKEAHKEHLPEFFKGE